MKMNGEIILNTVMGALIALIVFKIIDKLFLDKIVEKMLPASYEMLEDEEDED